MTAPAKKEFSPADRYRLRNLAWEKSGAVPPGRAMLCMGRKVVGYCDVADLANPVAIAKKANTVCLSAADFADVQEWLLR